jgi:uncharacterized protein (TIRG00374 family)
MRRFQQIAFLAGIVLLGGLVARMGPDRLARSLTRIGWGFLPILAVSGAGLLLNAASWRALLPDPKAVSTAAMTRMLAAAEAVTTVSPVGLMGGEVVRVALLSERLPTEAAGACVAMAAMAQFCGQVVFVLTGLPLAAMFLAGGALKTALFGVSAILLTLLAVVLRLAWSRDSSTRAAGLARRLLPRAWTDRASRWRLALGEALDRLRDHPEIFALAAALSLLAWQTGVLETWIVLRLLGQRFDLAGAYVIETFSVVIEGVLFFVPAKMGTQEGGRMLVFLAAGLDPAVGLTLGLARRVRELIWAGVGLALLGRFGISRRVLTDPAARAVSPPG